MEFADYWKELMSQIIGTMQSLLTTDTFHEVFHRDMQSALYSAQAFCNDIDNVVLLDRELEADQIYLLVYSLYGQVNHIIKMASIMINPELASMFDNTVLAEPERLQVVNIKTTGQKLFYMIGRVKDYYKLQCEKTDDLTFENTDLRPILSGVQKTLTARSREVTIEILDESIITYTDSLAVRTIILNLCLGWLEPMPEVRVNLKVSKDQQAQMATLVFTYDRISISFDELRNRLVPSLALENNTLELLLSTQSIERQNGNFESRLDGQQLTFKVNARR